MIIIRFRTGVQFFILSFLLLALLPYPCASAGDDDFSVIRVGQMVSHSKNFFSVTAPEAGLFTVTIHDDDHIYRIIQQDIQEGTSQVEWDGCSYNLEKLNTKYYSFDFVLSGTSGKKYDYSFRSPVVDNAQFLQFALPSSDTVYLSSGEEWFLEAKSILNGTIVLDFYSDSTGGIACSVQKPIHQGRVEHYTFSKLFGRKTPEEGAYTVKAYEISRPDDVFSFPLYVTDDLPPSAAVTVTGAVMPEDSADDAAIWEIMMKPSVVVDIDYLQHQNVFEGPDTSEKVVGTLHGQTQCLCVLEISGEWARIGAWRHEDAGYMEGWVPVSKLKKVYPGSEYGLLLDKKAQTLTVFRDGVRLETLLVSTGRMEKNKPDQETAAGCFLTGLHRVDFSMQGNRYDFVIQYDGGNLLHQIPYTSDGRKDFTYGRAYLGAKASHACIRMQDYPGEQSGINAYWIWTHIPYHTRLIILDDPEEREKNMILLSGSTPVPEPGSYPSGTGTAQPPDDEVIITFGGDFTAGDTDDEYAGIHAFASLFEQFGAYYFCGSLQTLFASDDLTCLSLNCTLKSDPNGKDAGRKSVIRGFPAYADIFPESSVELVCLESPSVFDYGAAGAEATAGALEGKAELIRQGRPFCITLKNRLFGFAACREDAFLADPSVIRKDIRLLKDSGCEYVICLCFWAEKAGTSHENLQEAMARACERAGADLVIGHGPASVQGMDMINGMPVIYSLGKLLPENPGKNRIYDALVVQAAFPCHREERSVRLHLIPVLSGSVSADTPYDYRPVPAEGEDRMRIFTALQSDTAVEIGILLGQK